MQKNAFYIELTEGEDLTVIANLTDQQVQDMLLDAQDTALSLVIIEVLCRNEVVAKKVQHFLNSADKDGEVALTISKKYLEGRPVYEVPIQVMGDTSKRPSIPQGDEYNSTFYWNEEMNRVCVVVNDALAEALEKQETARYIGVAAYSVGGIRQYGWIPKE